MKGCIHFNIRQNNRLPPPQSPAPSINIHIVSTCQGQCTLKHLLLSAWWPVHYGRSLADWVCLTERSSVSRYADCSSAYQSALGQAQHNRGYGGTSHQKTIVAAAVQQREIFSDGEILVSLFQEQDRSFELL